MAAQQDSTASVTEALKRANGCSGVTWTWRRYTAEADVLALWADWPGVTDSAYLAFRSPRYVRLPRAFSNGDFALGSITELHGGRGLTGIDISRMHVVIIRAEEREFFVVCHGVAFYRPDRIRRDDD